MFIGGDGARFYAHPIPHAMRSRLTERYELDTPIVGASLGVLSGPELAAAVSNAGGMGTLGCIGTPTMNAGHLRAAVKVTRSLTSRPFGVNFLTPLATDELIEVCVELQVPVVSFHLAIPSSRWIRTLQDTGVAWWQQVGSIDMAQDALTAGVDALIVQGCEAGGSNVGVSSLFTLLPAVADLSEEPLLLAAGGIADGRGMAAALALGADGVWVGTRLVATDEAFARSDYKRRIVSAVPGETYCRRVRLPHGDVSVRVLPAPPVTGEFAVRPPQDEVILREQLRLPTADADGSLGDLLLLAGESAALVHDIRPAREVIRRMHTEALVVLQQRLQPLAVPRRTARTSPPIR